MDKRGNFYQSTRKLGVETPIRRIPGISEFLQFMPGHSKHSRREVFAQLDPMRDILAETLEGWQPPQLVVIGAEKSGKSTLLERLLMIPIFPTAEEFCTRVPIHIRLRNSTEAKAPEIEVFNLTTSQTEEGPRMVSYQSGSVEVKEMMDRILGGCNKRISSDHVIIVHMQGPHIPSIDLVDMPGLTTTNELREQTANLIERHIQLHKDSSIYLMVVPATCPPNTSPVVQLVQSHHLESRTIGVFTMCDDVVQRKISSLAAHLPNPTDSCHGGVALEPHGQGWQGRWGALTSAPRPAPPSKISAPRPAPPSAPGLAWASPPPVTP